MVEEQALDALFVLAGDDQQRLRRAALLIDLARAKGGECVEVLGARIYTKVAGAASEGPRVGRWGQPGARDLLSAAVACVFWDGTSLACWGQQAILLG